MFFSLWSPEQIAQWIAAHSGTVEAVPIVNNKPRCGGCGKFLPKNLENEAYILIAEVPYHMKEKCITKGVEKTRAKNPYWNWKTENLVEK